MTKETERILYKKRRSSIDHQLDHKIIERFYNTKEYQNANLILTYYPLAEEINTLPIIEKALKDHKKVAIPKCVDNNLVFCMIEDLSKLQKGLFNIMEPIDNHFITDFSNSLCIVPGIAFDQNHNRLGYGKGYYDRFLSNYSMTKIGLCYEQLFVKKISTENYDIPVDMIITENNIY